MLAHEIDHVLESVSLFDFDLGYFELGGPADCVEGDLYAVYIGKAGLSIPSVSSMKSGSVNLLGPASIKVVLEL